MISCTEQGCAIGGELTMASVPALYAQGVAQMTGSALLMDFAQVQVADSAAVSLLLGWMRAAQKNNCALSVINLPASVMSLATLYGVEQMLPQAN